MARSVENRGLGDIIADYIRGVPSPALAVSVLAIPILFYFVFGIVASLKMPFAYDIAINYSAATVLRTRSGSIYDRDALRKAHQERIGSTFPDNDLYKELFTTYITPPTTALLMVPFSFLPFSAARVAFLLLNHLLYFGSMLLITRMLNASWKTMEGTGAWLSALTYYPFVVASSWLGQVDGIILFLLTVSLFFTYRHQDGWAGVWLVIAAAIKISPIVPLAFFLARRRWSVWRGVLVTAVVGFVFVVATAGSSTLMRFASSLLPLVSRGSGFFENQSLLGAIYHFVASPEALQSSDVMADLPVARLIWAFLSLTLILLVFRSVQRATLGHAPLVALAFGSFVLVGVLAGNISWDHYMTWLLIPTTALMVDWFRTRWIRGHIFWSLFLLAMVAIDFPGPFQVMLFPRLGRVIISCGTYGMLILLALSLMRLKRDAISVSGRTSELRKSIGIHLLIFI
jgi:hypothetical protein